MKSITRSPISSRNYRGRRRFTQGWVHQRDRAFDDEELTERDRQQNQTDAQYIDKIAKLYESAEAEPELDKTLKSKKRSYIRAKLGGGADACWRFPSPFGHRFQSLREEAADRQMRGTVTLQSLEREARAWSAGRRWPEGGCSRSAQGTAHAPHRAEGHRSASEVGLTELKRTLTFIPAGNAEARAGKKELSRLTSGCRSIAKKYTNGDCSFST